MTLGCLGSLKPMNWEPNPVLDDHLHQRSTWEQRSRAAFYGTDQEAHLLASFILEALADFTKRSSGQMWPRQGKEGEYSAGLVVSFIRTQFMVVKCAEESHLIEGSTLLRKQLEVVARLNEIDNSEGTLDKLLKNTPHLGALKSKVRRLHGSYSEIAHSSEPDHFQLLGYGAKDEHQHYISMYPKFSRNSYVLLHNAGHVFIEFWAWLQNYNERHGEPWDLEDFNLSAKAAFKVLSEWDVSSEGNKPEEASGKS